MTLTKWERIWGERFPGVPMQVVDVDEAGQRHALVSGSVDMCFSRLPLDREGLHAIPLYDELPVAWLSKDHVLAELDELSTADLADENVLYASDQASIDLASYSAAVLRVPMSVARNGSRRDMVYRLVTDAEPTSVVLAWLRDDENPLLEEFIGVVRGRTVNSSRTQAQRPGARARRREPGNSGPARRPGRQAAARSEGKAGRPSPLIRRRWTTRGPGPFHTTAACVGVVPTRMCA
ncbi:LysR family transcriptional regulator [Tessaracoccus sp. HDW20]|uniref:LysR substrate-binding domain-containing protein n=1 Tax=Tessaracoccus coleopterorum TaxID=2714950 RepID=UPI0018D2E4CD|nr:LysR family transcriptional regulator [Tessaracoccus coleopterorum]